MADPEELVADASAPSVPPTRVLKDIVYCGVCSLPPEFCEFDAKMLPKCKAWLKREHEEMYEGLYAVDGSSFACGRAASCGVDSVSASLPGMSRNELQRRLIS